MRQSRYNALEDSLSSERKRYSNAVLKRAREAGLNFKNPIHRLAIRKLADIDYELIMTMLMEEDK